MTGKGRRRVIDKSIWVFIFFLPFLSPVAYFGLLVALIYWFRNIKFSTVLNFKPRIFAFALIGWIFAVLLSVIFSINRVSSFGAFALFLFYPLVCLLIADSVRDSNGAERILQAAILSGVIVTAFGVVQYYTRLNLEFNVLFLKMSISTAPGITSTLGNPNRLAGYLGLILPLTFAFLLARKGIRKKILPGIVATLGLICLFFAKSLGGMMAIFVVVITISVIRNWKFSLILLALIFVFLTFNLNWITGVINKYSNLKPRLNAWEEVVPRVFKDYPITGSGLATYKEISYKYSKNPELVRSHAHSLYFNYLSELGIIGLGALLSVIIIFFYNCIVYLRKHSFLTAGGIIGGCTLSIFAVLIYGLVTTFLDYFQLGLLFWVVIGVGMGFSRSQVPVKKVSSMENS